MEKINLTDDRIYLTDENVSAIYSRFRDELQIKSTPHIGIFLRFGMGENCLAEEDGKFMVYTVDRTDIFDYKEFDRIEDAIDAFTSLYEEHKLVDDSKRMREILYQTLGLNIQENDVISEEHAKSI